MGATRALRYAGPMISSRGLVASVASLATLLTAACGGATEAPPRAPTSLPAVAATPPPAKAEARAPSPRRASLPEHLAPLAESACVVEGRGVALGEAVELRAGGQVFARVESGERMEARLAGDRGTLTVATARFEVTGEVTTRVVPVVPKRAPLSLDGFVKVYSARVSRVAGDHADLEVALPAVVKPTKPVAAALPCAELEVGRRDAPDDGKEVGLTRGASSPLRLTAGGAEVAQLVVAERDSRKLRGGLSMLEPMPAYRARELERRGAEVRLRVAEGGVSVEGWVSPSVVGKQAGILGILSGSARREPQLRSTCAHEVPLFVRAGERTFQVGRFLPAAAILHAPAEGGARSSEVAVALSEDPPAGALFRGLAGGAVKGPPRPVLFVHARDLEGCAVATR